MKILKCKYCSKDSSKLSPAYIKRILNRRVDGYVCRRCWNLYENMQSQKLKDKVSKGNKGRKCTPEQIAKMKLRRLSEKCKSDISNTMKFKWQDKKYSENQLIKMMAGNKKQPNKLEIEFLNFLNNKFLNEWKYVGNGGLFIGGRIPDYVHISGNKIIELFGSYWHDKSDEEKRTIHFAKYGFQTLVIWDKELNDKEKVFIKILNFLKGGNVL